MHNSYRELKEKHQKEFDEFPIKCAFTQDRFNQIMAEWGLESEDTDKIISIGCSSFIQKKDKDAFLEMLNRHNKEREEAMASDKDGTGYIFDMFLYELANHEYGYTMNAEDTLEALDLTMEQIQASQIMKSAWANAKKKYLAAFCD